MILNREKDRNRKQKQRKSRTRSYFNIFPSDSELSWRKKSVFFIASIDANEILKVDTVLPQRKADGCQLMLEKNQLMVTCLALVAT